MTEKGKRFLICIGGILVCIMLIWIIGTRFRKEEKQPIILSETEIETGTETETELVIAPGNTAEGSGAEQPGTETEAEESEEEAVDVMKGTEENLQEETKTVKQSLQPEATRPQEPEREALTNPAQKPDRTPAEIPADAGNAEASVPPEPEVSEPQAGDTSNGQIYIPGFGWVADEGGGVNSVPVDDMYENGNKIGVMD